MLSLMKDVDLHRIYALHNYFGHLYVICIMFFIWMIELYCLARLQFLRPLKIAKFAFSTTTMKFLQKQMLPGKETRKTLESDTKTFDVCVCVYIIVMLCVI